MTNAGGASGPPLFQARSTHNNDNANHNHRHNHHNLRHLPLHHNHGRLQPAEAHTASPHIRSPQNNDDDGSNPKKLHGRQVVIVQTVSVVHYIDATGAVTSVQTLGTDPAARTTLDIPAAASAALTAAGDPLPSVSLPVLVPDLSDGVPSSTASTESDTSSTSLSASSETLTSTPFSGSSAFPTLSGVFNSSSTRIPSLFSNHTVALFSNSTRTTSSSRSTFSSTRSRSSLFTSSTALNVPTVVAGGAGDSGNGGFGAQDPVPAPTETASDPPGLAPETRNAVVGGVVGSIAGIALIAVALLYLLKWRRQRGRGIMLLGDGDSTARGGKGLGFASGGPESPSSGGAMMERSGPFAIPAALAKLGGGNKRALEAPPSPPEPPSQEKGFYRVSGKKLISVLESGGDGYTDPHDSMGSRSSYYYRDSQSILDSLNTPPLQLGSPMRPVSGVPIFRDGPQRTALAEEAPSPAGQRRSAFPTPGRAPDPLGRSFASGSYASGSGSRFIEEET